MKFKETLTLLAVALMILSFISGILVEREKNKKPFDESFFFEGSGTENDPYMIKNITDLQNMKEDLEAQYELADDIDASETKNWNDGKGFEPVGSENKEFNGTLEGKDHNITELYINRPDRIGAGLFGVIGKNGSVGDLNLLSIEVKGHIFVGSLSGANKGEVYDSKSTGQVQGYEYVGGIFGVMSYGSVKNSSASVTVNGDGDKVGGLGGENRGLIIDSYAEGNVSGNNRTGGLVGSNYWDSRLETSYATGYVNGNEYVGGLVGYLGAHMPSGANVTNSYAMGDVNGNKKVGGLVGYINNPYGSLDKSYSTGEVNGLEYVGGLIGRSNSPKVENSFWDTETSKTERSDGGKGKATEEMKDVDTFTDKKTDGLNETWDFVGNPNDDERNNQIWNIEENINQGYPFLNWQDTDLKYNLTITSTEGGEVTEPGEGNFTYQAGTVVELKAVAEEGYQFVKWTGEVQSLQNLEANETSLTIDEEYAITANFEEIDTDERTLSINTVGEGTTEPKPGNHTFVFGEQVTIKALPKKNWSFEKWIGDIESTEKELTIVMDEDKNITANFVKVKDNYKLTINIEGNGTVKVEGEIVETSYTKYCLEGSEIEIISSSQENWSFSHWMGDHPTGEKEKSNISIVMNDDKSITAHFVKLKDNYKLTVEVDGKGTVKVDGEKVETPYTEYYSEGSEIEIISSSQENWSFSHWMGDHPTGEKEKSNISIVMNDDKSITAHFEKINTEIERELEIEVKGEGTTEPKPSSHLYYDGESVLIKAFPEEGWLFEKWTGDYESAKKEITIIMNEDKEIRAHFIRKAHFQIEIISPGEEEQVKKGDEVIIEYEAENIGKVEGQQDIELWIDGENIKTKKDLTLESKENVRETFIWEADREGKVELEIRAVDDGGNLTSSKTVTIFVEEGFKWWLVLPILLLTGAISGALIYIRKIKSKAQKEESDYESRDKNMIGHVNIKNLEPKKTYVKYTYSHIIVILGGYR